jgi:quinolinate synthase
MFLGAYVKKMTGRQNLRIWAGECHVHAGIRPADIAQRRAEHPDAEFLMHPECGCVSSLLYMKDDAASCAADAKILSTEGMVRHAQQAPGKEFIIATETGILHRLRKLNPGKSFFPVSEHAVCQFMKRITLEKVLRSLREGIYEIKVPPAIAEKARLSIERMIAIG